MMSWAKQRSKTNEESLRCMAKQRSFFDKVIQRLKRDAGQLWTGFALDGLVRAAYRAEPACGELDLVGDRFVGSLQQEAFICEADRIVLRQTGQEADDVWIYPGLMVAWDATPVTVDFSPLVAALAQNAAKLRANENAAKEDTEGEATDQASGGNANVTPDAGADGGADAAAGAAAGGADAAAGAATNADEISKGLASISAASVRSLFPSCFLFDVRDFGLTLYKTRIDALFLYPSYDADRDYGVLLAVGINLQKGLKCPFESKLVLQGSNLLEIFEGSRDERERLYGRCYARLDSGRHDEVFTPYDDEEAILRLATALVWLLLADDSRIEVSERRGIAHLHVREARESDGAEKELDLSFVGKSAAEADAEHAEHAEELARKMAETHKAEQEAKAAEDAARAEARKRAEEKAKARAEARQEKAEKRARAKEAARKAMEERARKKAEAARRAREQQGSQAETPQQEDKEQQAGQPAQVNREDQAARAAQAGQVAQTDQVAQDGSEDKAAQTNQANQANRTNQAAEAKQETPEKRKNQTSQTKQNPAWSSDTARTYAPSEEDSSDAILERLVRELEDRLEGVVVEDDLLDAFGETLLENDELKEQLAIQESKAATLDFHLKQARISIADAQRNAAGLEARASLLESMELPATPLEALKLAERAFPDKLVILPEAFKSAEEFKKGSAVETWAIVRSIATTLYRLVFETSSGSIAREFEAETGFELTLREMKLINKTSAFSQLRTFNYKGADREATAHVKGKGSKRGETLRVHFFVNHDDRHIVIAHCGEHLSTYDSSSV